MKTRDGERRGLEKELLKMIQEQMEESVKRPQLKHHEVLQGDEGYVTLGACQHGGIVGVTNCTKDNPEFASKAAELMALVFPDEVFTSITVVKDVKMPIHRDSYNDKSTYNLIVPLQVTADAGVWEELQPGDPFFGNYKEVNYKARALPGQVHSLKSEVRIRPDRFHCAVQEEAGPRILLAGHSISSWRKLRTENLEKLEELGFRVPNDEEERYLKLRAIKTSYEQMDNYPLVMNEGEAIENFENTDPAVEVDEEIRLCAKAAAENLYTYNIEDVLQELQGGELRVVHTVHQREVDENLEAWIPSMGEEVTALETIGAVKRRRGKEAITFLKNPGVTIVPGKAVFTVKPPSKEGQKYRRKARIVSCGNFQPKSSLEENYSGGAAAESVRLGVAEAARRQWSLCNGDISNAFLRAPVPQGTLLALRPPAVLVRAGLAEEGEIWEVCTALYGFRSSPRWWSTYRTRTMKEAVTESGYKFIQGVADPDIWRIVAQDGITTIGFVIVYVDDYLIAAERATCLEVHQWFATTWKTNELQFATPEASIRFLGMEIRQLTTQDGSFDGYSLDQEGYLEELLRHHNVGETDKSLLPAVKEWMSTDPATFPTTFTKECVKEAQSRTGELAWLCQRTRPDISYTTNTMRSLAVRDPQRVCQIGRKCLQYLSATKEWRLHFRTGSTTCLTTYTDSSYAPDGGKSHGGTVTFWSKCPVTWKSSKQALVTTSSAETELVEADGGKSHGGTVTFWSKCPVTWKSSKQALVTTSSAETELVEAHQGCLQMESVNALLVDFDVQPSGRTICVDNAAAITLATAEGGSWKTRHLKVRHRALRERVDERWVEVEYCPGDLQLADGLTKILTSQRMTQLMTFWGLHEPQGAPPGPVLRPLRQVRTLQQQQQHLEAQQQQQQHLEVDQPQQQAAATTSSTVTADNLGCCLGLLVTLLNVAKVSGQRSNPETHQPLAVDTSLELYGLVLMLVICSVAVWEFVRGCYRHHLDSARVKALQGETRLPKKDMRRLNTLLQRRPQDLTIDERQSLIALAEAAGVDLTGILQAEEPQRGATVSRGVATAQPEAPVLDPPTASAADEDFLRRRRRERASLIREPSPPRLPTYEDIIEEDERRRQRAARDLRSAPCEPLGSPSPTRRMRDVAVQVELLREMPRVVFTTPSGGCVHATRDCSTLNRSTKYVQKDVCAKCIPGQREHTEIPT
eukprot:s9297_g2.t1